MNDIVFIFKMFHFVVVVFFPVLAGGGLSRDSFTPIARDRKYMMDCETEHFQGNQSKSFCVSY